MDSKKIEVGMIVTDGRKLFSVLRIVNVFGIPAADLQRIRKDGTLFGGGHENLTTKIYNRPLSCLQEASSCKADR